MKLDGATTLPSVISDACTEKQFEILANEKLFGILSSKIYADKVLAPIRELSCNAFDANVAAGKPKEPIRIHLPRYGEPFFSVEDYGIGMDAHEVEDLYTTYGYSSKTDSNKMIGCLGLGSKSPFAYVDRFEVVSRKNGMEYDYQCIIENSIPKLIKFGEFPTEKQNGVTVKFNVSSSDIYLFRKKCAEFYSNFYPTPIFSESDFALEGAFDFSESNLQMLPGWKGDNSYVVMGNVAYAYSISSFPQTEDETISEFLSIFSTGTTAIKAEIGSVDITSSREMVELTQKSLEYIAKAHLAEVEKIRKRIEEEKFDDFTKELIRASEVRRKYSRFIKGDFLQRKMEKFSFPLSEEESSDFVWLDYTSGKEKRVTFTKKKGDDFNFSAGMFFGSNFRMVQSKSGEKIRAYTEIKEWGRTNKANILLFTGEEFKKKVESFGAKVYTVEDFDKLKKERKKREKLEKEKDYTGVYRTQRAIGKKFGVCFTPVEKNSSFSFDGKEHIFYLLISSRTIEASEFVKLKNFPKNQYSFFCRLDMLLPKNSVIVGLTKEGMKKWGKDERVKSLIEYLNNRFTKDAPEVKEIQRRKNLYSLESSNYIISKIDFPKGSLSEENEQFLESLEKKYDIDEESLKGFEDYFVIISEDTKINEVVSEVFKKFPLFNFFKNHSWNYDGTQDFSEIQNYINMKGKSE